MKRYILVKQVPLNDAAYSQTDDIDRATKSAASYLERIGESGTFHLIEVGSPAIAVTLEVARQTTVEVK